MRLLARHLPPYASASFDTWYLEVVLPEALVFAYWERVDPNYVPPVDKAPSRLLEHRNPGPGEEREFLVRFAAPYDDADHDDWMLESDLPDNLVRDYWARKKQEKKGEQDEMRAQKTPMRVSRVIAAGHVEYHTPHTRALATAVVQEPPVDVQTTISEVTRSAMKKMLIEGREIGKFSVIEAVAHAAESALHAFHAVDKDQPGKWYSRSEVCNKIMQTSPEVVEPIRTKYRAGANKARGKVVTETQKIRHEIASHLHHLCDKSVVAALKGVFERVKESDLPRANERMRIGFRKAMHDAQDNRWDAGDVLYVLLPGAGSLAASDRQKRKRSTDDTGRTHGAQQQHAAAGSSSSSFSGTGSSSSNPAAA